jgi:hypothetical protein
MVKHPNSILLASLLVILCASVVQGQGPSTPTMDTSGDDDSGVVYIMLFLLMMLNVFTPVIACLYQRYGRELMHKAQAEIDRVTSRISDRLSDAGRKVSNQMQT